VVVKKDEELWVTNISRTQDISISDLRVTIRCGQSINILAKGRNGKSLYNFTRKDIENSRNTGSLFKKQHLLKIREVAPIIFNHRLKRNASDIEVPDYPDLDFDDDESIEKFAEQSAELDFEDRRPILVVDPKYKKPTVDE
jgi:hypothetical protein